jgi:hypothetical protein
LFFLNDANTIDDSLEYFKTSSYINKESPILFMITSNKDNYVWSYNMIDLERIESNLFSNKKLESNKKAVLS